MGENDVKGVRYYSGTKLPIEGVYANKEHGWCGAYAALLTVATVAVVVACAILIAAR